MVPLLSGAVGLRRRRSPSGFAAYEQPTFQFVTMTTLGVGDITAHPLSVWGHMLVIAQVIVGYVLLGALITRLAILFQQVE